MAEYPHVKFGDPQEVVDARLRATGTVRWHDLTLIPCQPVPPVEPVLQVPVMYVANEAYEIMSGLMRNCTSRIQAESFMRMVAQSDLFAKGVGRLCYRRKSVFRAGDLPLLYNRYPFLAACTKGYKPNQVWGEAEVRETFSALLLYYIKWATFQRIRALHTDDHGYSWMTSPDAAPVPMSKAVAIRRLCEACFGEGCQKKVARAVGYSPQHINAVWNGRSPASERLANLIRGMARKHYAELGAAIKQYDEV